MSFLIHQTLGESMLAMSDEPASHKGGRPRKNGSREPNGRLSRKFTRLISDAEKRAGLPSEGMSPAEIKRFLSSGTAHIRAQKYGTPIGRLCLDGKLTPSQFAAGCWWDEILQKYRSAMNSPAPNPKAASMGSTGGSPIDPDSELGQKITAGELAVVKKFATVHTRVCAEGVLAENTLRQCCEGFGRFPVGYQELMRLRRVLDVVGNYMTPTDVDKR